MLVVWVIEDCGHYPMMDLISTVLYDPQSCSIVSLDGFIEQPWQGVMRVYSVWTSMDDIMVTGQSMLGCGVH